MRHHKIVIIALFVLASGCALKHRPTPDRLTRNVEKALGQFQTAVRHWCDPVVPPFTLTRCADASVATTNASVYLRDTLAPALRTWKSGDKAPAVYATFYRLIDDAVRTVRPVVSSTTTSLRDAITALTEALGQMGDAFYGKQGA